MKPCIISLPPLSSVLAADAAGDIATARILLSASVAPRLFRIIDALASSFAPRSQAVPIFFDFHPPVW